jgi:hypothetical protein
MISRIPDDSEHDQRDEYLGKWCQLHVGDPFGRGL